MSHRDAPSDPTGPLVKDPVLHPRCAAERGAGRAGRTGRGLAQDVTVSAQRRKRLIGPPDLVIFPQAVGHLGTVGQDAFR
jgi:hypothetical protein